MVSLPRAPAISLTKIQLVIITLRFLGSLDASLLSVHTPFRGRAKLPVARSANEIRAWTASVLVGLGVPRAKIEGGMSKSPKP